MTICVDTMIFIDILKDEFPEGQEKFYRAFSKGEILMTSAINVAELMPMFEGREKELRRFLGDHRVKILPIDLESAVIGSERWIKYMKRREKRYCPSCRTPLPGRTKILADFLIGGFALRNCDQILTRDLGVYKTYFKDLEQM